MRRPEREARFTRCVLVVGHREARVAHRFGGLRCGWFGRRRVRDEARFAQVGLGGDDALPLNVIVAKEFDLRGAFRFHEEFAVAVELLNKGLVDVKPLISDIFPYQECVKAFQTAGDRTKAMKVLVTFD